MTGSPSKVEEADRIISLQLHFVDDDACSGFLREVFA